MGRKGYWEVYGEKVGKVDERELVRAGVLTSRIFKMYYK